MSIISRLLAFLLYSSASILSLSGCYGSQREREAASTSWRPKLISKNKEEPHWVLVPGVLVCDESECRYVVAPPLDALEIRTREEVVWEVTLLRELLERSEYWEVFVEKQKKGLSDELLDDENGVNPLELCKALNELGFKGRMVFYCIQIREAFRLFSTSSEASVHLFVYDVPLCDVILHDTATDKGSRPGWSLVYSDRHGLYTDYGRNTIRRILEQVLHQHVRE